MDSYSISVSGSSCPDVDAARAAFDEFKGKLVAIGGTVTGSFYPQAPAAAEPSTEKTADVQAP